jgi:hydrogenase-4 component B
MNVLVFVALACFAVGAAFDLVFGVGRTRLRGVPYLLGAAGSACLVAVGWGTVAGPVARVDLGRALGIGRTVLVADHLAGLFLLLTSGLGVAISLCFASWVRPEGRARGRGLASCYLLLLASVAVIVLAGDAFMFLFAWESLTLSFYGLAAIERRADDQPVASWLTGAVGKVSGAFLLFGFLLLAGASHSFSLAAWHAVGTGPLRAAAYALIVAGFAAKLGIVPFHVWMRVGYPAAPGPARAAMAGLAVNVGVYGLWRFLDVLGRPPTWLVVVVLSLGAVTALLGITFASVEPNLNRLISFSSVENAGIIVTAYGVALAGSAVGRPSLVAVGLLAATLQTVAHALAKSTLFVASGTVEAAAGTVALDQLGGLSRALPWTGTAFTVGALSLAGLPPTVGFVSEWFVLESLLQQLRVRELELKLAMAGAGALIALAAGLALLTFVRVLGLAFFGRQATPVPAGRDAGWVGRVGLISLAAGCLALAACTPWEIRLLTHGLEPLVPVAVTSRALASPFVLQPVFNEFSVLSPSWLWIVMPLIFGGVVVATVALSRGRLLRVRHVAPWHSATGGVEGNDRYTSFGFANPVRHVLGNLLGTRRELRRQEPPGAPHVELSTTVVEPVEAYVYGPLRKVALAVVGVAKRLQSGRLDAYIAYMLLALLAVLALVTGFR